MATNNPYAIENFVTSGWRGYFPLWSAIWRYYLVGRVVAFLIAFLFVKYLGFFGWFFGFMIWVPYWIWSLVMLWRCAPNTDWPYFGLAVRAWVYIEAVLALFYVDALTLTDL